MYKVVDSHARNNFLPKHFGSHAFFFEAMVYSFADKMIANYRGGMWQFAVTDDEKIPFLFLSQRSEEVTNPFGGSAYTLQGDLAGMVICTFALCYLCEHLFSKKVDNVQFVTMYDKLRKESYLLAENQHASDALFKLTD